jgi:hypothetical protein
MLQRGGNRPTQQSLGHPPPGYSADTGEKQSIDSGSALALTYVPREGNFENGSWTGPNFSTYIGAGVANMTVSQQATVEMHEFIHATSPGDWYSQNLVDMRNPSQYGGVTANIYDIQKDCGTDLPQGFPPH